MNPFTIIERLRRKAIDRFGEMQPETRALSEDEKYTADKLFNMLVSYVEEAAVTESYETLEMADREEDSESVVFSDDEYEVGLCTEADDTSGSKEEIPLGVIYKIADLHEEGRSNKSLLKLYPRLRHEKQLRRVLKYAKVRGTTKQQLTRVKNFVKDKFQNARNNNLPVHDRDLRRWARQEAARLNLTNFKCSDYFLFRLKKKLRISSRKVVSVVTKRAVSQERNLAESAKNFVETVNRTSPEYDRVMNADQSGFVYEFTSTRTLSHVGEKKTTLVAGNLSKTSHSDTIMPLITMDGKLLSPLFICVQEVTGNEFGPLVQRGLLQACPTNVLVTCSKTGKMTKVQVQKWMDGCLVPNIIGRTHLLVDSWPGQGKETLEEYVNKALQDSSDDIDEHPEDCQCGEKALHVSTIPAGTTSTSQPCDKILVRQCKVLIRAMYNIISLDEMEFKNSREDIIKIQSLAHNQLQADAFTNMLKYAWSGCGYQNGFRGEFKTVKQVCFSWNEDEQEFCSEREKDIFIKCAHCNKCLCAEHFLSFVCFD